LDFESFSQMVSLLYTNHLKVLVNDKFVMMKQKKIALIGDTLGNSGVEKVHALLSIFFQNAGLEVCNIILWDLVTYEYAGSLQVIHTRSEMKKAIQENEFDYIIDFRIRLDFFQEFLISRFMYPKNVFYTVHSGSLDFYFPKSSFLSKLIYKKRNIVTVSKGIKEAILSRKITDKVNCIYNPLNFETIARLKKDVIMEKYVNYILAVGRLDGIKQFDQLILAYSHSILPKKGIKLIIIGEGPNNYMSLCLKLGLESSVEFKGFLVNPFPYFKNALFSVLCSKNEGFPNVLIESLACNTPVVSFDCFSGPSEIIINKQNGLLVDNQNFEKLTNAMNLFVVDENLYSKCKQNALKSVEKFSLENIGNQWLEYLGIDL
jgi:glycosyltransferase involved in cell wall biosynthesis